MFAREFCIILYLDFDASQIEAGVKHFWFFVFLVECCLLVVLYRVDVGKCYFTQGFFNVLACGFVEILVVAIKRLLLYVIITGIRVRVRVEWMNVDLLNTQSNLAFSVCFDFCSLPETAFLGTFRLLFLSPSVCCSFHTSGDNRSVHIYRFFFIYFTY